MIERDQPQTLPAEQLTIALSSVEDGTMTKTSLPHDVDQVVENRQQFVAQAQGDLARTALVYVTFDSDDYCRYRRVESRDLNVGITTPADALVTTDKEVGLFLPLADCCGAVLYDPVKEVLMMSHLGRHSVEQFGGVGSVRYLTEEFGSAPSDLYVWLSPAAGGERYPLYRRQSQALHDVITDDLQYAGVPSTNIERSIIDTTASDDYYSHSEFIKGNRSGVNGRFAIYAAMKEPPA